MPKIPVVLLLVVVLLAGCGEVTVFGHVVREGSKTSEARKDSTPAPASTPTPAQTPVAAATTHTPVTPDQTTSAPSSVATSQNSSNSDEDVKSSRIQHVKAVTLFVAPEVTNQVAKDSTADSRLDVGALLAVIKTELQSRGLFNISEAGDEASQSDVALEVYIDRYDLHANTNFVIFGSTPHTGTLAGNLLLRDEHDNTVPVSHVEAYSRIAVPESGQAKNLLQPLYHEFAVTVADSVAGTHVTSSVVHDQPLQ